MASHLVVGVFHLVGWNDQKKAALIHPAVTKTKQKK